MEIMKIIGSNNRGKTVNLNRVDFQLKISEIDVLIDFLKSCKKVFCSRQHDCSVKKIVVKNDEVTCEKLTTYNDIKAIGSDYIDCELHYADWCKDKTESKTCKDIVVHTPFKAKENKDGTFVWKNLYQ